MKKHLGSEEEDEGIFITLPLQPIILFNFDTFYLTVHKVFYHLAYKLHFKNICALILGFQQTGIIMGKQVSK